MRLNTRVPRACVLAASALNAAFPVSAIAFMAFRHAPVTPILPLAVTASTVAANGDMNPDGVAFVPTRFPAGGILNAGDLLISDFANKEGKAGLGVSLVRIRPTGEQSTFFQGSGVGLTAGLKVLRAGFVLVASLPTLDGTTATVQQGSLLVIDKNGSQVTSIADPDLLDGPRELTVLDRGQTALVFVSNVLSGTVTRLVLTVTRTATGQTVTASNLTRIASGYVHRLDPAGSVIGPSGLAYDPRHDALFVASTGDNTIFRVANAGSTTADNGRGMVLCNDPVHLHGPLGLIIGPNGHLLATNSSGVLADPSNSSDVVEFTDHGRFVSQQDIDSKSGGAVGLHFTRDETGVLRLAWINDYGSTVTIVRFLPPDW
jgi:DNA-binding beta-propeller fold protein YncE